MLPRRSRGASKDDNPSRSLRSILGAFGHAGSHRGTFSSRSAWRMGAYEVEVSMVKAAGESR
jgi:hypothetical protein